MSYLSLRALSKTYGDFHAVRSMELDVQQGEFLSLLGPSGCGKTTTLQMVAGFVTPSAGQVTLEGRDLTSVVPEKRDIGVVFQSYALFPHMSVAQNIGFGLVMRRMKREEIRQRVEETLAMVQLTGLGERYPAMLSGGQRQRVAIARALAIRPRVLLLDEPMSNLDAKLRGEMHVELRTLQRRLGITAILVTHDQVEAMTMSDRIAIMTNGAIAQLGRPQDLYDRPGSEFVCRFLGHANLIEGRVVSRNGEQASVQAASMVIPVHAAEQPGTGVQLFVRPERLRIVSNEAGKVKGRVVTRLFLGGLWIYEVETELGTLRVTTQHQGQELAQEGSLVGIDWNPDDLRTVKAERSHG